MASIYFLITGAALFLILVVWIVVLEVRLRKLLAGKDGKSLEGVITTHSTHIAALAKATEENRNDISILGEKFMRSIQGVGVVRFNPFRDSGGNHSFAIALIDEHNDGVIISTLYARERTNVSAKIIKAGISELELTEEEKEALERAKKSR